MAENKFNDALSLVFENASGIADIVRASQGTSDAPQRQPRVTEADQTTLPTNSVPAMQPASGNISQLSIPKSVGGLIGLSILGLIVYKIVK